MRTIGVMAAIAIAFLVLTSPGQDAVVAQQPPTVQDVSPFPAENQDVLASAVEGLQRSVVDLADTLDDRVPAEIETQFTSLSSLPAEVDSPDLAEKYDELEERVAALEASATASPAKGYVASVSRAKSGGSTGGTVYAPPLQYSTPTGAYAYQRPATTVSYVQPMQTWNVAATQPVMRARTRSVTYAPVSNCPGGVCTAPTAVPARNVQTSRGLLGFGVLGRRR